MPKISDSSKNSAKSILIIGAGNLGTSLYLALNKIYPSEILLSGRRNYRQISAKYKIDQKNYAAGPDQEIMGTMKYIFISVQDDNIKTVANGLARYDVNGKYIFHVSGSRDAAELDILKNAGAYTAALHPLQTFPRPFCKPDTFSGIYWSFQGDENGYAFAEKITSRLQGKLIRLSAGQKKSLHIAGVFAANYLVGLLSVAESVLENAGFDKVAFNEILQPLLQGVTTNYKKATATEILSGPLKRGDLDIIEKHLQYLKETNGPLGLYKELAKVILDNNDFRIENREDLAELINSKTD